MTKDFRNEAFGRLYRGALKAITAFEGRNEGAIEHEFGNDIGVAPATIQRYKQGTAIPDLRGIEIFAEVAVRRGFFDREWLTRFLRAAHHPEWRELVERLRPVGKVEQRQEYTRDNLPAPAYAQFIARPEAMRQVVDGLRQRAAVVALVSLGGMGKSSLALEVAKRSLDPTAASDDRPLFDAAVWLSDKDQPGTTQLDTVLDEIAHTLGHSGYTSLARAHKRREVTNLLRSRRVLLIMDNFETVTDNELLNWLLRLPEPSKALITTRHYRAEFQRGVWLVELEAMNRLEAGQLIDQRAAQLNLASISTVRERLITLSGGNPRALEMIMGQIKSTRQMPQSLLETFDVRDQMLLAELFGHSWELLSDEAQHLLRVIAVFPTSASPISLKDVSGFSSATVEEAIQELFELALVEPAASFDPRERRISLHPLTRAFVLAQHSVDTASVDDLIRRWITWCAAFAMQHGGYQISDISQLAILDSEEPNLFAAARLAAERCLDHEVIQLARGLEFYYYIRAFWGKKLELQRWYIAAARRFGTIDEQMNALALHIQLLSRLDHNEQEATEHLHQLEALIQPGNLTGARAFQYHHTMGQYLLGRAHGNPANVQAASEHWRWLLDHQEPLEPLMRYAAQHWLAHCFARQGRREEARTLYTEALKAATEQAVPRFVARNKLGMALLDLEEGDLFGASARLDEVRSLTAQDDWEQQAGLAHAEGRLFEQRGDWLAAESRYSDAIALLARMGLIREQSEVEHQRAVLRGEDI